MTPDQLVISKQHKLVSTHFYLSFSKSRFISIQLRVLYIQNK